MASTKRNAQGVISKFITPGPLDFHPFLHRINTCGVKIRLLLKKFRIFNSQSREGGKLILPR